MDSEDQQLWKEVTASVRPLGDTSPHDPFPMAPLYATSWPTNPCPGSLDLHGLTLNQAFDQTKRFLYHAHGAGLKEVVIITGRSGAICAEFPAWTTTIPIITRYAILPNGGSFKVSLRKR